MDHQSQHCKAEKKFDTFVLGGTMNQDECPVVSRKDGDGISDSFKRLGRRQAVDHCNERAGRCLSRELRPQRQRLPRRAHARAVL